MERSSQTHHTMDRKLVSAQPHEVEYLARTHGTTVAEIEQVIAEIGTRSRAQLEEELDRRYKHRSIAHHADGEKR